MLAVLIHVISLVFALIRYRLVVCPTTTTYHASMPFPFLLLIPLLLIQPLAYLHGRLTLFGLFYKPTFHAPSFAIDNTSFIIPGLNQCEDIEYVETVVGGRIYAACQGYEKSRFSWWPAWGVWDGPEAGLKADGGIWVVDVKVG
jgi:hypothetical protein